MADRSDFEARLQQALRPVEPPEDLQLRLLTRLTALVDLAAGELDGWELSAVRDPRTWVPTIAAAAVGGTAAVGLVVLRTQQKRQARRAASRSPIGLVGSTVADLGREAGRLAGQARRRVS